jgi:glycosyltransferase involved in cell wall biosynthesis
MPAARPRIAVVIPVYREEAVLPELFRRLDAVFATRPGEEWVTVFVNDGSRDRSGELLAARAAAVPGTRVLELSRNFGHQPALTAGLAHAADADAAVTMDADMQDPPELIPQLVDAWRGGAEVVLAVRRSRAEGGLRRAGFETFHALFGRLTDFPIENNTGTFGLLDRAAVAAFNALPEKHRFFPGLRAWIGFSHADILYDRQERAAGQPAQTMRRLIRYALDGIFSFSKLPLRLLTYVGCVVGLTGFALGLYYVVKRLINAENAPMGFTTLAAVVLFIGGVQLIGIGILGEYLGRIYDEVKRRPNYIVRRKTGCD